MKNLIKTLLIVKTLFLFFLVVFSSFCFSQDNTKDKSGTDYPTLDNMVTTSDFIFEGKLLKRDFLIDKDSVIYTSANVRISKIFKGEESTDSTIEIIYKGGYYAGISIPYQISTHGYVLAKGAEGIFFLRANKTGVSLRKDNQSFLLTYNYIHYNQYYPSGKRAHNGSIPYDDLEKELFQRIESITGQKRKILGPNMFELPTRKKGKP
jgi:hypothetical protein